LIKIIVTSIVSFGLGAVTTYSLLLQNTHEATIVEVQPITETQRNHSSQPTSVHADYIRQLEALNRKLTQELQAAREPVKKDLAHTPTQPRVEMADFEAYYNARKNSEAFSQYLQNVSSTGYVKDLAGKFDAEAVDSQWATDYEARLNTLLESNSVSNSFLPQSVICKSRRCQIKVAITSIEQANQVMETFSAAINSNELAIDKSMVVSAPDMEEGVVSLYVVRDADVKMHE
jgi:hypothetical protein